jgi:hypothetical protein
VANGLRDLGFSSTYDDLLLSNCTSCAVLQDMSAYWTPPLMFEFANGTAQIVPQIGGMLVWVQMCKYAFGSKTVLDIIFSLGITLLLSRKGSR